MDTIRTVYMNLLALLYLHSMFQLLYAIMCVSFTNRETRPVKCWTLESKRTFSLVSVGMVNRSFLLFFARLTIFIVKLDRQLIGKFN